MQKLIYIVVFWVGLLSSWNVLGQTVATKETIVLPTGMIRLKEAFASISDQTGCVFSYDSNNINDQAFVFIGKNNRFTLESSLSTILAPDVKYKRINKYIVIFRNVNQNLPDEKPLKSNKNLDLTDLKPLASEIVYLFPKVDFSDTIKVKRPSSLGGGTSSPLSSNVTEKTLLEKQWMLDATYDPHLLHLSLILGVKSFFGKASFGYDYHDSYHLGLGVGMKIPITPTLGLSLDLSQYALAFGRTKKMDINAFTTELNPKVTYALSKRLQLKAGPSVYRLQSSLKTKNERIDLGSHWGCNASVGVQFLLFESK
ncbi:MAG TPA: hypothetical protein VFP20_00210 [Bacteroidales bacterium]|nr:hypothetical protein [Bacteroidales bacterium]